MIFSQCGDPSIYVVICLPVLFLYPLGGNITSLDAAHLCLSVRMLALLWLYHGGRQTYQLTWWQHNFLSRQNSLCVGCWVRHRLLAMTQCRTCVLTYIVYFNLVITLFDTRCDFSITILLNLVKIHNTIITVVMSEYIVRLRCLVLNPWLINLKVSNH